MNPDIRPQDDLFGHVNGRWLEETEIPSDRSSWGPFVQLADVAEEQVRVIIEDLAAAEPSKLSESGAKINALFTSFMDVDRANQLALTPIQPLLDAITAAKDTTELASLIGELERVGVSGLFGSYIDTDDRKSDRYLFNIGQGGLGPPDAYSYPERKPGTGGAQSRGRVCQAA